MRDRSVLIGEGKVSYRPFGPRSYVWLLAALSLFSAKIDLSELGSFTLTCRWQAGVPCCRQDHQSFIGWFCSSEDLGRLYSVATLTYPDKQRSLRLDTDRGMIDLPKTLPQNELHEEEAERFVDRDPGKPLAWTWEVREPIQQMLMTPAMFLMFLGLALWRSTRYAVALSAENDALTVRHSLWGLPLSRQEIPLQPGDRIELEQPGSLAPPPDKLLWIRFSRRTYRLELVSESGRRIPLTRTRTTERGIVEKAAAAINQLLEEHAAQTSSPEQAA